MKFREKSIDKLVNILIGTYDFSQKTPSRASNRLAAWPPRNYGLYNLLTIAS
jgi:hypothetical protein